jgi:hypothetical protein
LELREEIATHLPTGDYFNLRLASRMMATAFHGVIFWRSRFRKQGSRGFWSDIAADRGADSQVDWAMIYHATSRLRRRLEFTMKVWDVASWIGNALAAVDMPSLRPLAFAGRALQEYRGDETISGDRIVRTWISPRLLGIAISYSCSPKPTTACDYGNVIHTVKICALEFQYKNRNTVTVGTPHIEAMQRWPRTSQESPWLCDCFRGRLVFDARSFAGFCGHYYDDGTMSSLGVLQRGKALPVSIAGGYRRTPLYEMRLEHVAEVVTTFKVSLSSSIVSVTELTRI